MITPQFAAGEPASTAALRTKLGIGGATVVTVPADALIDAQIKGVAAALWALELMSLTHFIATCASLHRIVPLGGQRLARTTNISSVLNALCD